MNDDIQRSLGRIEGKLDLFLDSFSAHEVKDDRRFGDVSKRLGAMEKWQAKVIGIGLAAGVVGGFLVKVFLGA